MNSEIPFDCKYVCKVLNLISSHPLKSIKIMYVSNTFCNPRIVFIYRIKDIMFGLIISSEYLYVLAFSVFYDVQSLILHKIQAFMEIVLIK